MFKLKLSAVLLKDVQQIIVDQSFLAATEEQVKLEAKAFLDVFRNDGWYVVKQTAEIISLMN